MPVLWTISFSAKKIIFTFMDSLKDTVTTFTAEKTHKWILKKKNSYGSLLRVYCGLEESDHFFLEVRQVLYNEKRPKTCDFIKYHLPYRSWNLDGLERVFFYLYQLPSRSHHLVHMEFFLWGFLKSESSDNQAHYLPSVGGRNSALYQRKTTKFMQRH